MALPFAALLGDALPRLPLAEPVRETLRPFAGRRIELRVAGVRIDLRVTEDGSFAADGAGAADLRLEVPADRLLRRALGDDTAFEGLAFEGDATLAQALGRLAREQPLDWAAALESVLPPAVAVPLVRAANRARDALRQTRERALDGLADHLRFESEWVVPRAEAEPFLRSVDELRESLDRLDARLRRLEAQRR